MPPIATANGAWHIAHAGDTAVLFPHVDALASDEYDRAVLGGLLGRLHRMTAEIISPAQHETFAPDWLPVYQQSLRRVFEHSRPDTVLNRLRGFLERYDGELQRDWQVYRTIRRRCAQQRFPLVLTHSDAPGNVLRSRSGQLYLVDWDEIKLAPAERDTWFLAFDTTFMMGYRQQVPEYTMDTLAFSFYLYNRYFEDLLGYVLEILSDTPLEHREKNLADLYATCVDWLRPQLRALDP